MCKTKLTNMKYVVISLLLILLVSFSNHNTENDFNTKLYRKYFTEQQRIELFKIVSFIDSIVLAQYRFAEIDKAYQYCYDSICKLSDSSHEEYTVNDGEERENFIFSLDTILFNKIWSKQIPIRVKTRDTTLHYPENFYSIDLNPNGEYVKLLDNLGKSNRYYKKVHEGIISSGTFSPVFYAGFFNHEYSFDFKSISDRLFFSIALLTLDEHIEKKVERYLKKSSAHNKG